MRSPEIYQDSIRTPQGVPVHSQYILAQDEGCYNHGTDSYIMQSWLVGQALLFFLSTYLI